MSTKNERFTQLLENFLINNNEIQAIIVSDQQGLVINGVKKLDHDMELVSILSSIVNPILERIRNEFAFEKFGTAAFDTEHFRLLFVSVSQRATLSIVLDSMASVDRISPYAYLLAEKTAQFLSPGEQTDVQITLPTFEYVETTAERLKHQLYELKLDTGGIYRFKFIVIGDHEVGKTALIRRYVDNKFSHDYRTTIGLNILSKQFEFFGNEVKLTLWDVGAQKFFKRFRKTYYTGAQAAFIVFDLTRKDTFVNIKTWYGELNEFLKDKELPIILVGNKSDLKDQRASTFKEGANLANELSGEKGISRISYIETSALNGENVIDAFRLITYHYIMEIKDQEELELDKKIFSEISSILDNKKPLEITFITESTYWSPGLQILTDVKQLGKHKKMKDERDEKLFKYESALVLRNYIFGNFYVDNSDGIFCIFDAREKEKIDKKWRDTILQIIDNAKEKSAVLIGVRLSEDADWSKIIEGFNIGEEIEKKVESLMFFKISEDYREEIYDQLLIMLKELDRIAWMEMAQGS
jgi:Ras-related protein Rab-11A